MRYRLVWLFVSVFVGALASLVLSNHVFVPEQQESRFEPIDGTFSAAQYIDIDLEKKDRLFFRYGPISDSGVELERVVNGETEWMVFLEPLGVPHSKYNHDVKVRIKDGEIRVNSRASGGNFFERRNLDDGSQIERK